MADDRKLPSGYTELVAPDRLSPSELSGESVVPIASEGGAQGGRVPPAKMRSTVNYEGLSNLQEVEARLSKRMRGELPLLSDPDKREAKGKPVEPPQAVVDPATGAEVGPITSGTVQSPSPDELDRAMDRADEASASSAFSVEGNNPAPAPAEAHPAVTTTVGFSTDSGTYIIPVIGVYECEYGVAVEVVSDANAAVFIPAVGSKFVLKWGKGMSMECYFPGTSFDRGNGLLMVFLAAVAGTGKKDEVQ